MDVEPYDGDRHREALWELKAAFERTLGSSTGDAEKEGRYAGKLTDRYREEYLEWVERCSARNERSVQVAVDGGGVGGYVFVLPESHAYIWDAAVLNEIYLREGVRGSGVADDLLDAAVEVARGQTLPLERMVLDVDRANERARAFYGRHGFEHWGEMLAREL